MNFAIGSFIFPDIVWLTLDGSEINHPGNRITHELTEVFKQAKVFVCLEMIYMYISGSAQNTVNRVMLIMLYRAFIK